MALPDPKGIGDLTWLLNRIYYYTKIAKYEIRDNLLNYLRKYTNVLMQWEMALVDGNVPKNIDWTDLKIETDYEIDNHQVTRILRDIEKLYKLAILVEDKQLKNEILRMLFQTTNHFLDYVIALEGEPIDESEIDKDLNEVERRLEEIRKTN